MLWCNLSVAGALNQIKDTHETAQNSPIQYNRNKDILAET